MHILDMLSFISIITHVGNIQNNFAVSFQVNAAFDIHIGVNIHVALFSSYIQIAASGELTGFVNAKEQICIASGSGDIDVAFNILLNSNIFAKHIANVGYRISAIITVWIVYTSKIIIITSVVSLIIDARNMYFISFRTSSSYSADTFNAAASDSYIAFIIISNICVASCLHVAVNINRTIFTTACSINGYTAAI